MESIKFNFDQIPEKEARVLGQTLLEACKKFYSDPKNLAAYEAWKHSRRLNMNKALNVVGRILIFCVGEVSMYFAMMDPVVHIMLGDDINASRLLISWAALILTAIIDDKVLPVFNYDKGNNVHVK